MRLALLIAIAALVLAISIPSFAQPPSGPPNGRGFQSTARYDKDGDGLVSKEEFPGPDSMFTKLDTDGDGYLSGDELRGVRERDIMFAKADANSDGKVTLEEFIAYQKQMFSDLDENKDGALSSDEFAAGLGPGGPQGQFGGPGGMGQQGQWGDPAAMAQRMMQRSDTNGDGKLSRDEWRGPEGSFENLDKNGDGYIDASELSQMDMSTFGGMRRGGQGQPGGGGRQRGQGGGGAYGGGG
jgi:Ca2+-binding EF-hand superfamily protein